LPGEARFCFQCGTPQPVEQPKDRALKINWKQDLAPQITALFFAGLRDRVRDEYDEGKVSEFSEKVYESGFRDLVQRRAQQTAEKLMTQLNLDAISARQADKNIKRLLEELMDFFIIRYCKDLVPVTLPESILKYQQLSLEQIDLFQMILDYLDFAHESEVVYTDFLVMPVNKLKNAGRSFLFPEKNEKILLICDQSILGSCKEGFALTEKGLYWKAHLQNPRKVLYLNLSDLEKEKEWLNINGYFFNVNPALNLKMLRLLKKIRLLLEDQ